MIQPSNNEDVARWAHERLRLNILDGVWEVEVVDRMKEQYSLENVTNIGRPSVSINLFSNTITQIAIHHDNPAKIGNDGLDEEAAALWSNIVETSHLNPTLKANVEKLLGLRETLVFAHVTNDGIQLEVVPPCEIVVDKTGGDRSIPTALRRARCYAITGEDGKPTNQDAWECWDVSDQAKPRYWIEKADGKEITVTVDPKHDGSYKWVDEEGAYIPCQFYRAKITSSTWDPYTYAEIVHGTLDIAIHWSMWGVSQRNNSWPQWYGVDLELPPSSIATAGAGAPNPPATVALAPNSILFVKSLAGQNGSMSQLQPDPLLEMAQGILLKQRTILRTSASTPTTSWRPGPSPGSPSRSSGLCSGR